MALLTRRSAEKTKTGLAVWFAGLIAVVSGTAGFIVGTLDAYDTLAQRFFPSPPKIDEDYFVFKTIDWDTPDWSETFLADFKEQFSGYSISIPSWVTDELAAAPKLVSEICDAWTPEGSDADQKNKFTQFCTSNLRAQPYMGAYAVRNAEDKSLSAVKLNFDSIVVAEQPFIDMYDGFHTFKLSDDNKCVTEFEWTGCKYNIASRSTERTNVGTLLPAEGFVMPIYVAWRLTFPSYTEVPEGEEFGAEGLYDTLSRGPLRLPANVNVDGHQALKARTMFKSPTIELGFFDGRG